MYVLSYSEVQGVTISIICTSLDSLHKMIEKLGLKQFSVQWLESY